MRLYHGAKEGQLEFPIHPQGRMLTISELNKINIGRTKNGRPPLKQGIRTANMGRKYSTDFGVGFYLTVDNTFANITACSIGKQGYHYTFSCEFEELSIYSFDTTDLRWLIYIAFNRGSFNRSFAPNLYDSITDFEQRFDIVSGPTANDRYFNVVQNFLSYETDDNLRIGHTAVLNILSATRLPTQYTFLSTKACSRLRLLEEHHLTESEYKQYSALADERRKAQLNLTNHIIDVTPDTYQGYTLEGIAWILEKEGFLFPNIPTEMEYDAELSREIKSKIYGVSEENYRGEFFDR